MRNGRSEAYVIGLLACLTLTAASTQAQQAQIPSQDAPALEAPPVVLEEAPPVVAEEAPPIPAPRLVLVSTQAIGVDPVLTRFVNEQLARTATELGYAVVQGEETARFAAQVTLPYPPAPADLWRVTYASGSQRGVFARVWAESGNYVIEVLVASLDGTGPFVQRGTSGAPDLQSVVHGLLQQTLPPPSAQMAAPNVAAPAPPTTDSTPASGAATPSLVLEAQVSTTAPATLGRRWVLAFQTEAALGAGGEFFYNHLLGARVDYRLTREIYGGAYFGYANLRGRNQRVSNALMYVQIEDRIAVSKNSPVTIPLRLALGYLPRNGPVMRLSSGVFYAVSPRISVGSEILVPTFWVIRDRVLFSMDFAVELQITL